MNEIIHLMILAFVLLTVTGYYMVHSMMTKMAKNMEDGLRTILSILIAGGISFLAMPIMMLFMAPFLPLGIVLMFFSIQSLASQPNNWIHQAYTKFSPQGSVLKFAVVLTLLNSIILGLTFFFLYPQAK